jgi:hypothetical protein
MPSNQPVASVSQTPGASNTQAKDEQDPNAKQLADLLKQNQVNVTSPDEFTKAYAAIQQKQTLTPQQEKTLGAFTKAVIAKPGLTSQVATLMKAIGSKQQPDANKPVPAQVAPTPGA